MEMMIIKEQEVLGKQFKIYGDLENPLFLAKDVAKWIDYDTNKVGQMLKTVDDDEKLTTTIKWSGQNREMWFLTEDGLYEVLMQSRKPIAKAFKKEVKIILKSVRQHGMFAKEDLLNDLDLLIKTATELRDERAKIQKLKNTVAVQEQQIVELQPKANYCDIVLNCKELVSTSVIAKDFGLSARALNTILKDNKIQFKQGDIWLLYQKYAQQGYTQTKTHAYVNFFGEEKAKIHTYWTQKGRLFLYEVLKKNDILPMIERDM